ncbi:zinc finger and BTB domain-containing protein 49-like [Rhagoletis pomonella]|uniref:zinc finger and BTB domain-containing protein 49-like n=1 Tax=Rhagoletis pomonella TaxID=28610 RepID=UPI001786EB1E|nr:zinc finger and BTB domain-containing protein 49-like [Rhagoletis pomonella]
MYCRLCLFQAQILIPLRDESGNVSTDILSTVEKYTRVELTSEDCICVSCWSSVDSFRKFCLLVAERQSQYAWSRELVTQEEDIFESAEGVTATKKDAKACLESLNANLERTNESEAIGSANSSIVSEQRYRRENDGINLKTPRKSEYDFDCMDVTAGERGTYVAAIPEKPICSEADANIATSVECLAMEEQEMCSEEFYLQHKQDRNDRVELLLLQNNETNTTSNKIQAEAISNQTESPQRCVKKLANEENHSISLSTRKLGRPRRSDAASQAADDQLIASHMQLFCELCKFEADNFKALKDHFKAIHNSNGYVVCCGKRLYKLGILIDHINVHRNAAYFSCSSCGSHFADRLCLRNHLLLKHQKPAESPLQCTTCGVRFAKVRFLQRHVRKHEDVNACDLCGKEMPTRVTLNAHKRLCHGSQQQQRQHACSICARIFKTARRLREHMATHTGEYLYHCNYCDKPFKCASNLHAHRKWKHPAEWGRDQSVKASKENTSSAFRQSNPV